MNSEHRSRRRRFPASVPLGALATLGLVATTAGFGQPPESRLECDGDRGFWRFFGWRDRIEACEVREQAVAATGALVVDARDNGDVRVTGSDRDDVLVRVRVNTWAESDDEAEALLSEIEIRTDGTVRAEGPRRGGGRPAWSVSYEIFTPRRTDLILDGRNGGVTIADVTGDIEFETTNGAVRLSGLAGDVRGRTTNGGVDVTFTGSTWEGERFDVGTTNGGVRLRVPEGYSARFEASTTNGGVHIGPPAAVQGRFGRDVTATLGDGGPLVRVRTTNGGVRVTSD